ncbi:hypothetical protein [Capybara microvirus Cap1_SP_128]|nr:hypothetical protein [Capybara microvirus Cap1_SP_128]
MIYFYVVFYKKGNDYQWSYPFMHPSIDGVTNYIIEQLGVDVEIIKVIRLSCCDMNNQVMIPYREEIYVDEKLDQEFSKIKKEKELQYEKNENVESEE